MSTGPEGGAGAPGPYDFFAPAAVSSRPDAPAPVAPTAAATWAPPPAPPPPVRQQGESGLSRGLAITITCIGLALAFGLMQVSDQVADPGGVIDQALRRALVLTLIFYVLIGVALALFCGLGRVGLTWVRESVPEALLLGLPLGLAGGGLAVAVNSAVKGHLTSDPNVELLVGGGGGLRIVLTLVVTTALAPLIEETLFRGVLAGTLLESGTRLAVVGSAVAFAVWHMNVVSLRYYFFMGVLFAWLWLKRGLVASIAAHAAFNGVLTLAAVLATTGSGHVTQLGQLSFSVPGGWHVVASASSAEHLVVDGPAGAVLDAMVLPADSRVTLAVLLERLRASETGADIRVLPGSAREVSVLGGEAATADLLVAGQPGHLLHVLTGGRVHQLVMVTSGSPGAERDWQHVLATARLG